MSDFNSLTLKGPGVGFSEKISQLPLGVVFSTGGTVNSITFTKPNANYLRGAMLAYARPPDVCIPVTKYAKIHFTDDKADCWSQTQYGCYTYTDSGRVTEYLWRSGTGYMAYAKINNTTNKLDMKFIGTNGSDTAYLRGWVSV